MSTSWKCQGELCSLYTTSITEQNCKKYLNNLLFNLGFVDDPESDDGYNYKQMMARDERRFKMADGNEDHIADKEEFTAFLHPEEYEHMKDIVVLVGQFYPKLKLMWNLFVSFLPL